MNIDWKCQLLGGELFSQDSFFENCMSRLVYSSKFLEIEVLIMWPSHDGFFEGFCKS
jgi:hypothetical protein